MKNILLTILALAIVFSAPPGALAQTAPTMTTLSSAINDSARSFSVASNSNFGPQANPDSFAGNTSRQLAIVDHEVMEVYSTSGSAGITVTRGVLGTAATSHKSGSYVFVGPPQSVYTYDLTGSCAETSMRYLPVFSVNRADKTMHMYDCINGTWSVQDMPSDVNQPALYKVCTVPIGSVAYGSFGTSTTTSATAQLNSSIYVPHSFIATGLTNLNGSAVDGASLKVFILNSASGRVLANSAVAGTAASGNDAFQAIAFTSPRLVTGPATYFVSLQDDTADVNAVRTVAASTFNNVIAGQTTSVFGTVAAITVPTTFTADKAPIACLY